MTDFRIVYTEVPGLSNLVVTYQKDDHTREGNWNSPIMPWVFFKDIQNTGSALKNGKGPVAGAPGGHPLHLIFWGSFWESGPGADRRVSIETWTKDLCASVYFEQLAQYGVTHAPVYHGSTIVTSPEAPGAVKQDDAMNRTMELVEDQISDGKLQVPGGPKMLYIVMMPDGFSLTDSGSVAGQHDYEFDFPFLGDHYWVGWVGPQSASPAFTMVLLSHELVEMLTDPESDAWRWDPTRKGFTEISDFLFAPGGKLQTAFVNGVQVQSYWSRAHNAPLIPIDRDYKARLRAHIKETSRRVTQTGQFHLPQGANHACSPDLRVCCFEDRPYTWQQYSIDEIAHVWISTARYASPVASDWRINGTPVAGENDLPITVQAQVVDGLDAALSTKTYILHYKEVPGGLDITTKSFDGNFSIIVSCAVSETAITGNNINTPTAIPAIEIDFKCAETLYEDAYMKQFEACLTAQAERFNRKYKPRGKPRPGEHINFIGDLLKENQLPSYVRPSEYSRLRLAMKALRSANAMMPEESRLSYTQSLARHFPALQASTRLTRKNDRSE